MEVLDAIILGILQGLTEFLPVSSSGHLVLAQKFLGADNDLLENALIFDLTLHLGTVCAVVYCYWRDIPGIFKAMGKDGGKDSDGVSYPKNIIWFFVVSFIATAVIGLLLDDSVESLFTNARYAAIGLIVTGIILAGSLAAKKKGSLLELNFWKSFLIGIAQGIAIFPGISRSGSTIVTGMFLGIRGADAARYSFLLSVPTILAASVFQFMGDISGSVAVGMENYIIGFITSALFGVLAIKALISILKKSNIAWFAPYCLIMGVITYFLVG